MKTPTGINLRKIPTSPNEDYMAGEDGQIYSRTRYKGFGRKDYVDWYALKGHTATKGYMHVSMCHENVKKTQSVHRLVCLAFHGIPEPLTLQVRHLDGNPSNNVPGNLVWGTQEENWQDRKAHGHGNEGEKHPMAKLTDIEVAHLRWALEKGLCSRNHAARILGMSGAGVSHAVASR